MGGRTFTLGQKLRTAAIVLVLIAAVVTGVIFAANKIGGKGDAKGDNGDSNPREERLGDVGEDDDDLTVKLSRAEANKKYGDAKSKYVLQSSFLNMGHLRETLTGFDDAVSIPFAADQAWIDTQRASDMPEDVLAKLMNDKMEEWKKEFSALKGYELEVALRDKIKDEVMRNPIFGDMLARTFLKSSQIKEQNPWLVEFVKNMDESYARAKDDIPDDEQLIGLEAWIHYENAEAKTKEDLSKLMINDTVNAEKGQYDYFYPAAQIAELFDQFFKYMGRQKLTSTDNWCLVPNGDHATQRTIEAAYQEDGEAYVFAHVTKKGEATIVIGFNDKDGKGDKRSELFKDVPTPQKSTPDADEPKPDDPDPNPGDGKVKLTIKYQYEDGSKAANTFVGYYNKGAHYEVPSPVVDGYTPDRAVVKGGPITKDTTEVVVYYKKGVELHTATINYIYRESGKSAADSYVKQMKPGESRTRKSPEIGGYTADKASVTLNMQHEDIVVNVYYDKNKENPDFTLTVVYKFTDGSQAAPTHTEKHKVGDSYSVSSPSVKDATPDRSVVSGKMPNYDLTEVVTYTKKGEDPKVWKLTVNYVIADGQVAAPASKIEDHQAGDNYNVPSPAVAGYTPDIAVVTGKMPNHDLTVTVTYTKNKIEDPVYTVTVNYVIADGQVAAPAPKSERHKQGESYSIGSPSVSGYVADREVVSGTMPNHDVTETVTYRRQDGNGTKDSEDDPGKKDENDQGSGKGDDPGDGKDQNGNDGGSNPPERTDDGGGNSDGKPEENRNNDGSDQTKPATPPITDGADDITVDDNGNQSEVKDEPENSGKVTDDDVMQYQSPAAQPAEAAPAAVEAVADDVEAVEAAAPAVQSQDETPAENSSTPADEDGDFQNDRPE